MRLVQLDVLRAVAVILVLASHLPVAPRDSGAVTVGVGDFFLVHGHLGVDLFFVLSGFLVSGLLFREYLKAGSVDVRRFLLRRGLKIYPAFYVFLVVTVLIRIKLGSVFTPAQVVCEALFVQNYGPSVWTHTWSLAVEEHFYLLLSAFVYLAVRARPSGPFLGLPALFVVVAVTEIVLRIITFDALPWANKTHVFPTHLRIDSLLFGVLLSYYYHTHKGFGPFVARNRGVLFAGSVATVVAAQAIPHPLLAYAAGLTLTYIGFGGVVISFVCTPLSPHGLARRFLDALGYVGSHSYSIYLWHTAVPTFGLILIKKLFDWAPGYYLHVIGATAANIAFGIIIANCVEIPILRIRDRLFPSKVGNLSPRAGGDAETGTVRALPQEEPSRQSATATLNR